MEREKVLYLIKYYKDIDKNLKFNNGIMRDYEDNYYSPTVTPSYTDGIHGKGDISAPVENMVLSIPQDVQNHINQLKRSNSRLVEERVEFWTLLDQLDYTHKTLIYQFYIKGHRWAKISQELNYSQSHCRNRRDKAIEEFGTILEGSGIMAKILEGRK